VQAMTNLVPFMAMAAQTDISKIVDGLGISKNPALKVVVKEGGKPDVVYDIPANSLPSLPTNFPEKFQLSEGARIEVQIPLAVTNSDSLEKNKDSAKNAAKNLADKLGENFIVIGAGIKINDIPHKERPMLKLEGVKSIEALAKIANQKLQPEQMPGSSMPTPLLIPKLQPSRSNQPSPPSSPPPSVPRPSRSMNPSPSSPLPSVSPMQPTFLAPPPLPPASSLPPPPPLPPADSQPKPPSELPPSKTQPSQPPIEKSGINTPSATTPTPSPATTPPPSLGKNFAANFKPNPTVGKLHGKTPPGPPPGEPPSWAQKHKPAVSPDDHVVKESIRRVEAPKDPSGGRDT